MTQITAALVNELRSKTGQGMMECKKALSETGGDIQKAIDYFRRKGVKTSIAARAAGEGRVAVAVSPDGKAAAAVEINCNTDFTAKSELVVKIALDAAAKLATNPSIDLQNDRQVKDALTGAAQTTGENVQLGRAIVMTNPAGQVGAYVYAISNKIAVLMSFGGKADAELVKQLGGHITFARPLGLTRADVPPNIVAKEREIAVEQAKATGKPQQIAEKIAEGKLNSFFAERVLLDQEFFNPAVFKGRVADYLKQHGVTLEKYVRLEVGQA